MENWGLIWDWNYKSNLAWLKYSDYLWNNASQDLKAGGGRTAERKKREIMLSIQKGNGNSSSTVK